MDKRIIIPFLISVVFNVFMLEMFCRLYGTRNIQKKKKEWINISYEKVFNYSAGLIDKNSLRKFDSNNQKKKGTKRSGKISGNNNLDKISMSSPFLDLSDLSLSRFRIKHYEPEILDGFSQDERKILSNHTLTSFSLVVDGRDENELNSAEKEFYSFYKRVHKGFLSSIIRTLREMGVGVPNILAKIGDKKYLFTGRLKYDKEGNLVMLKISRGSTNEYAQLFFENILKNIGPLYNPPAPLLDEEDEFIIFINLAII